MSWRFVLAGILLLVLASPARSDAATLRVGSKRFAESYILAEIVVALARSEGIDAVHEQGLGGTAVTYRALADGAIDVYPEYTGTIAEAIVKDGSTDLRHLEDVLAARGLAISASLGFQNTYAIAASREAATRERLARVSDLAGHPALRVGVSHELLGRSDGWPGLARRYGLEAITPVALDHGLAYDAVASGSIDVTDVYTTDAKIARYGLVVLEDDRRFFPAYEAVLLYRIDARARFPALGRVLDRLRGSIDAPTMQRLNGRAELDGVPFPRVAAEHLGAGTSAPERGRGFLDGLLASIRRHGPRHVALVAAALALSALVGTPLGVLAHARRRVGVLVLGATGLVQTIPSLALFCFFIPVLGIGPLPALAALSLYGLLPIVRNTHAGLASIPEDLRDAAEALGLTPFERLWHVELPLAARTITAGVKTSAVVAVGSATVAAFVGAGGFGEPISTGLSLNDVPMILQGALPAAALALVVEALFALGAIAVERAPWRSPR